MKSIISAWSTPTDTVTMTALAWWWTPLLSISAGLMPLVSMTVTGRL